MSIMKFSNKAKSIVLAILVLAAVSALSVGITLVAVKAGTPASGADYNQNQPAISDAPAAQFGGTAAKNTDSIAIPGYDFLDLKADTQEQTAALYNPEVNSCYFRISLLLDGETLWRSELLAPGQTVSQQTLSRALPSGEYSAVLKYECFADETETTPLNGSEIGLALRVR